MKRVLGSQDRYAELQGQNWILRVRLVELIGRLDDQGAANAELRHTVEQQTRRIASHEQASADLHGRLKALETANTVNTTQPEQSGASLGCSGAVVMRSWSCRRKSACQQDPTA